MKLRKASLAIIEQVRIILNEYAYAISLRQIFYRLVVKQIIENINKNYHKLSRLCTEGRKAGLLDKKKFADRLREVQQPSTWTDLSDFMDTVKNAYRRDYWIQQPAYIEIWTEKDALRGVIGPVTKEYAVPLLVVRGQVSTTAIDQACERYEANQDKNCYLYYFGDFDPSGIAIYQSLKSRIKEYSDIPLDIHFERIALTPDQIDYYKLPQDPAKKSDPNYKKFFAEFGDRCVELDALPPDALITLIRQTIGQHIDWDIWNETASIESQETEELQEFIAGRE